MTTHNSLEVSSKKLITEADSPVTTNAPVITPKEVKYMLFLKLPTITEEKKFRQDKAKIIS